MCLERSFEERAGRGHRQQAAGHHATRLRLPLARAAHLDAVSLLWWHRTGAASTTHEFEETLFSFVSPVTYWPAQWLGVRIVDKAKLEVFAHCRLFMRYPKYRPLPFIVRAIRVHTMHGSLLILTTGRTG